MSDRRACWYWDATFNKWTGGYLLGWGVESSEPGSTNTVAIIERGTDGSVELYAPYWITFASCPTGKPRGTGN